MTMIWNRAASQGYDDILHSKFVGEFDSISSLAVLVCQKDHALFFYLFSDSIDNAVVPSSFCHDSSQKKIKPRSWIYFGKCISIMIESENSKVLQICLLDDYIGKSGPSTSWKREEEWFERLGSYLSCIVPELVCSDTHVRSVIHNWVWMNRMLI